MFREIWLSETQIFLNIMICICENDSVARRPPASEEGGMAVPKFHRWPKTLIPMQRFRGIRENGETFHLPWHFFHQKRPSHKLLRCLHDLTWCTVSVILLVSQMCDRCPEQRKLVLDIYGSSKEPSTNGAFSSSDCSLDLLLILYLPNSTKISTNIETARLSSQSNNW